LPQEEGAATTTAAEAGEIKDDQLEDGDLLRALMGNLLVVDVRRKDIRQIDVTKKIDGLATIAVSEAI
jgi:hypothetical protein